MDMKRLKKQMDFILEIDKEKNIKRQTLITDASRQETDAEHAWHLAVMCALLSEYSNEKIDVAHTMLMVLMHDLVEIDAGDTYAYDEEANKSKEEREQEEREYLHRIFPGGTAQKAAVEQQLKERPKWQENSGMSSRPWRHRSPNLPTHWTRSSRQSSTTLQAAFPGRVIRYTLIRS